VRRLGRESDDKKAVPSQSGRVSTSSSPNSANSSAMVDCGSRARPRAWAAAMVSDGNVAASPPRPPPGEGPAACPAPGDRYGPSAVPVPPGESRATRAAPRSGIMPRPVQAGPARRATCSGGAEPPPPDGGVAFPKRALIPQRQRCRPGKSPPGMHHGTESPHPPGGAWFGDQRMGTGCCPGASRKPGHPPRRRCQH
jgi:hypothetical protein